MTSSMTSNISIPLNKVEFYETRLPASWLWFTLLAVQTYSLNSKQARNELGTPGGAKSFPRGTQMFYTMSIVLNYIQHIFKGAKKF